jgi:PIN domain nuclease of toxin-antitoxin system
MVVLDTHVVLWLAQSPEDLSEAAHQAISEQRRRDGLAISCQTLWELSMLISRGRVRVAISLADFLEAVELNFHVLPVTGKIAERAMRFSESYPNDPTDQIIGATAVVHGLPLLTKDGPIRASGEVNCVW